MTEPAPQQPPISRKWEAYIVSGLLPPADECALQGTDADGFQGAFLNITATRLQGNSPDGHGAWPTVKQDITAAFIGKKPVQEKTANSVLFRLYFGELAAPLDHLRHVFVTVRVTNLEKKLGIIQTASRVW